MTTDRAKRYAANRWRFFKAGLSDVLCFARAALLDGDLGYWRNGRLLI